MIDIRDNLYVIKCTTEGCHSKIRIGEGSFPGGINDKGGLIIKCSNCQALIPLRVRNPLDATNVISGGEVIDKWDKDAHREREMLEKHNIPIERVSSVEKLLVIGFDDTIELPAFRTNEIPVFTDSVNNFEKIAYDKLNENKELIEAQYHAYHNGFYIKGKDSSTWSTVFIDYDLEGIPQKACFAKLIQTEKDLNIDKLYLIGHSNTDLHLSIDGIYSKTNCLNFLERMLNRWRYTAKEVLIVVPFIGYHYESSLSEVKTLWEWLQQNMNVDKTNLVTRKGTYELFKKAQTKTDIPYDLLVEWGLLEPLFESIEKGDMTFFQSSHAKYYVGVYDDKVEVLSGSFNIHRGPSFENVSFETYSKEFFLKRYLHMFKGFEYNDTTLDFPVHTIEIKDGGPSNYVRDSAYFFNLWNQVNNV